MEMGAGRVIVAPRLRIMGIPIYCTRRGANVARDLISRIIFGMELRFPNVQSERTG
jgi:hypothetical protein